MTRAGHAEGRSAGNPKQIKIRVAGGKLALNSEHVCVKGLNGLARNARTNVGLALDIVHHHIAVVAAKRIGRAGTLALHIQEQNRLKLFDLTPQTPTGSSGYVEELVVVRSDLNGRARRKPVDHLVQVGWTDVPAT